MIGQVIGLTGRAQHGKDSVAAALVEKGWARLSFADKLKELAYAVNPQIEHEGHDRPHVDRLQDLVDDMGWEQAKLIPEVRRFLQELGTQARKVLGPNVWVDPVMHQADELMALGKSVVFSDVRFPNEAQAVRNYGGHVLRVVRPGFDNGVDPLHPSESQVDDLGHIKTIVNNGSLEDLRYKARRAPYAV